MSLIIAYAYRSAKSLPEQLVALRAGTDWQWHERDSEFWGDYLSAQAPVEEVMVKLFAENDGYLIELKTLTPEADALWEERTRSVLRQFAPLVGAEEVRRAPPNN